MLKKLNGFYVSLFTIFVLVYVANVINPIVFDDDFSYGVKGNLFLLQWEEYLNWHGRYFTHFIGRIILQLRDPWTNFLTSTIVLALSISTANFIVPNFWKSHNQKYLPAFLFSISMFFTLSVGSWTTLTETTQVFAYHMSFIFTLCFLYPYFQNIYNPQYYFNSILIFIIGIFVGNSHE